MKAKALFAIVSALALSHLLAPSASAVLVRATGATVPKTASVTNIVRHDGDGLICLHVEAGTNANPATAVLPIVCDITVPRFVDVSGNLFAIFPGRTIAAGPGGPLGRTTPKFATSPTGTFVGNSDVGTNTVSSPAPAPLTQACATGRWTATPGFFLNNPSCHLLNP